MGIPKIIRLEFLRGCTTPVEEPGILQRSIFLRLQFLKVIILYMSTGNPQGFLFLRLGFLRGSGF